MGKVLFCYLSFHQHFVPCVMDYKCTVTCMYMSTTCGLHARPITIGCIWRPNHVLLPFGVMSGHMQVACICTDINEVH